MRLWWWSSWLRWQSSGFWSSRNSWNVVNGLATNSKYDISTENRGRLFKIFLFVIAHWESDSANFIHIIQLRSTLVSRKKSYFAKYSAISHVLIPRFSVRHFDNNTLGDTEATCWTFRMFSMHKITSDRYSSKSSTFGVSDAWSRIPAWSTDVWARLLHRIVFRDHFQAAWILNLLRPVVRCSTLGQKTSNVCAWYGRRSDCGNGRSTFPGQHIAHNFANHISPRKGCGRKTWNI